MSGKTVLRVGDKILVDIPNTIGREQKGTRPWIVIAIPTKRKHDRQRLELVIAVPLTRTEHRWWTVVRLSENSFALCHNLQSLSVERSMKTLGRIDEKSLAKIRYVTSSLLFHPLR